MGDFLEEFKRKKEEMETEDCRKIRRVKRCSECLRYYECFPHKYKEKQNEQK